MVSTYDNSIRFHLFEIIVKANCYLSTPFVRILVWTKFAYDVILFRCNFAVHDDKLSNV